MILVQDFTPIFSVDAEVLVQRGKLCGGVETAPSASEALRRFQACYDDGQVIDVEKLSNRYDMSIAEYNEFHLWKEYNLQDDYIYFF